ncbi:hypothetical protein A9168_03235 [Macellibacteroides sp. HH-ZS]|nr:hypothetical protein A9168_03235 [Macellibacteroides sp. HH-ZS]
MIYIPPILVKSSTLKGINEYSERKDEFLYSMLNDNQEDTSNFATINFENLFDENFKAIVLGEPGCGKSELVTQIKNQGPERSKTIIDYSLTSYSENALIEFLKDGYEDSADNIFCFDALDEVDSNLFPKVVKFISSINEKYPKSSIIVTCRSYYIDNNLSLIGILSDFQFILVDLFDEDRIKNFINVIIKKPNLKEFLLNKLKEDNKSVGITPIFQIPRYLTEICKVINDNNYEVNIIQEWKRTDYFEKAIYFKLQNDIKKRKRGKNLPNELEISQRMLEKLALIMEIKRTNRISKDEFISMLDDINSNINTSFLASFDIDLFVSRTLKKTDNYIEFHNTEFQEYLAAKEIIRLRSSEQVLYELIVDSDLGHIYSNWYDVLRFVVEMHPAILLPIANFLVNKRDGLADEQLLKLLKESNIKELSKNEKGRLFDIFYAYFQSHEVHLHNYVNYLTQLYTSENYVCFKQVIAKDEKMRYSYRIYNQFYLTSRLINEELFNEDQKEFWIREYVNYAKDKSDYEIQKASIYALADTKQGDLLIELKANVYGNTDVEKVYLSALSRTCPNERFSIELFFDGINKKYKEGVYGLLSVDKLEEVIYICNRLIDEDGLFKRFFYYSLYVSGYIEIPQILSKLWDSSPDIKIITSSLVKKMLSTNFLYRKEKELVFELVKLLKSKSSNYLFEYVEYFDDIWDITHSISILQFLISKDQLISFKAILTQKRDISFAEYVCESLLANIRNEDNSNPEKNDIYEEGRIHFPEAYLNWETPKEEKKVDYSIQKEQIRRLNEADPNDSFQIVDIYRESLSSRLVVLDEQLKEKIITAAKTVLGVIDLDKLKIVRTSSSTIEIVYPTYYFFDQYVLTALELRLEEELKTTYRDKLIDYLPIGYSNGPENKELLEKIYSLIGDLTDADKDRMYDQLNKREDDYTILHITHFFNVIDKYKLKQFKPLVEKYVEKENDDEYTAIKALSLLAEDFMEMEESFFIDIFNRFESDKIKKDSLGEIANQILILKYNNSDAVNWRFNYLKQNIYEIDDYYFEGSRGLSREESEVMTPSFCNCFIESKRDDYVSQFYDLLEFSLTINTERKFWRYCHYLQTMVMVYFKVLNRKENLLTIRDKIKKHPNQIAVQQFKYLLREAELYVLSNSEPLEIQSAVECYNEIRLKRYLPIRNDRDLFDMVNKALLKLKNTIENEGLYRPLSDMASRSHISEDLIQKTLKVTLENELLKLGIRNSDIEREVNLYDNKRTDILVKYGFIGPIMLELKLLGNQEIQNSSQRIKYKEKLKQYIGGTHALYSYYLIFKVEDKPSDDKGFDAIEVEYKDIDNLYTLLFDCVRYNIKKKSESDSIENPLPLKKNEKKNK